MKPLDSLGAIYAQHPRLFGLTAKRGPHGATIFGWRDYGTGEGGRLATAEPPDVIALASALLEEMRLLRREKRKPPLTETRERPLTKAAGKGMR